MAEIACPDAHVVAAEQANERLRRRAVPVATPVDLASAIHGCAGVGRAFGPTVAAIDCRDLGLSGRNRQGPFHLFAFVAVVTLGLLPGVGRGVSLVPLSPPGV
jgi:hypothetical protein